LPPALGGFTPELIILLELLKGLPAKFFPRESPLKPSRFPTNDFGMNELVGKLLLPLPRRQQSAYKCFANFRFPQHRGFRQKSLKLAMAALASKGAANRP
jgi:hypothetical protein